MKIYYKLFLIKDLETLPDEPIDENTIIGVSSSLDPYRNPNTILITKELAHSTDLILGVTKFNEIEHYIVDQNGDCPLYNE
jgi:hypothetical protein